MSAPKKTEKVLLGSRHRVVIGGVLRGPDEIVEVPAQDAETLRAEGYTVPESDAEYVENIEAIRAQRAAEESDQAHREAAQEAAAARERAGVTEEQARAIKRQRELNAIKHHEPLGD